MPDVLAVPYSTSYYPYSTGYSSIDDVRARVNAGTWDPTSPTAFPSVSQVNAWLAEATANIDVALATRGYYVPLQPMAGWTPPTGMPIWNGIGLGAWLLLRNIAATFAVFMVEQSRHGSHSAQQDQNAITHLQVFDDLTTRLETGADNLEAFGVGGAFAPDIDVAKGAITGSFGVTLADSTVTEGPAFTRLMQLGSGWESAVGS